MARVTARLDDRGQLLLVGAIGIAVLLVVLAVVLNTAIYTEAIATDSATANEERSVVAYEDGAERAIAGIILSTNRGSDGTVTEDELETNLREDVAQWSDLSDRHRATDGASGTLSVDEVTYGTRILQDETQREFTDGDGTADWTVAENVSRVIEFRMTITAERLQDLGNESFSVRVEDGDGSVRELDVYANEDDEVTVDTGTDTCSSPGETVTIDLVSGTVDGTPCAGLSVTDDLEPSSDIDYRNADTVEGEYALTVDGGAETTVDAGGTESPRAVPAIDGAEATLTYHSSTLSYESELRIRPGETDG